MRQPTLTKRCYNGLNELVIETSERRRFAIVPGYATWPPQWVCNHGRSRLSIAYGRQKTWKRGPTFAIIWVLRIDGAVAARGD
jgi:hypothetical protein